MKILLVHNYYPVIGGGEDSVVEEECGMLEQAGHTVIPFFMYTKERGFRDFVVSALCLVWNPFSYSRIRRVLKASQPDVVHCHNTFPLLSPSIYWACRRENIPVVQTLHNYRLVCANGLFLRKGLVCEDCSEKTFAWPAIRHRCYRDSLAGSVLLVLLQWIHRILGTWGNKVDQYIALTEFSKSRFVESGVLSADKICVKPNFIDDRQALIECPEKKKQAVFIGRLWPEKGCVVLVEAWVDAFKRNFGLGGYELLIIGDGPEREKAEALCESDPENFSIHFAGTLPREEVLKQLQVSRFMVLPSIWYEGFPMTIVEAFACGIPIVSAKLGSMLSIVEEPKTGFFFEVGHVEQLADRILWSVEHEQEIESMGRNARDRYEENYTQEKNLGFLESIYTGVLS